MTHPTPTAAPEAPPLPLRGEGLGVGGHPLTNPRPGPEPACPGHDPGGPLPTRSVSQTKEVPGHARDGFALLAALTFLATPTQAQIIPTGTPAADILLSQAIADQRLFLTCSALEPDTHSFLLEAWQRDVAKAVDILTAAKVAPEAITAFTTAAAPENLMLAPDTPWSEVRQFCDTYPDWATDYAGMRFTILRTQLPMAFQ